MVKKLDHVERNYRILETKMIEKMNAALDYGKELIDSELDAGIFNFVVKPVVKSFYDYWAEGDAREGTLQQIKVTLDCGKKLVRNGNSAMLDDIVEKYFKEYLEGDQTYRQCKRNHKNFKKLEKNTKECFKSQLESTIKFLKVKDDINDYDGLTRAAFRTKKEAYEALAQQLEYNDKGIRIVEKDPSILKVPTGKTIILKVLRKGFEETKRELKQALNETYN
ncbi:MAG: hypothetical protein P8Y70_08105 [Candidatus Lokiarchaeota archaeon]